MPRVEGNEMSFEGVGFWQAEFWEGREKRENFIEAEEKTKGIQTHMILGICNIDTVH